MSYSYVTCIHLHQWLGSSVVLRQTVNYHSVFYVHHLITLSPTFKDTLDQIQPRKYLIEAAYRD